MIVRGVFYVVHAYTVDSTRDGEEDKYNQMSSFTPQLETNMKTTSSKHFKL